MQYGITDTLATHWPPLTSLSCLAMPPRGSNTSPQHYVKVIFVP